jgi:hypothetical protein
VSSDGGEGKLLAVIGIIVLVLVIAILFASQ